MIIGAAAILISALLINRPFSVNKIKNSLSSKPNMMKPSESSLYSQERA
jgi:hypothetical protein